MKTTLKGIKELANLYSVEDITHIKQEEAEQLQKLEGYFTTIAYSTGAYGVTGKVLQGNNTNKLYAITSRSNAIYMF